jgi:hypothetical protein
VWGGKWLACCRKFDTNIENKARKKRSGLAEENRWARRTTQVS